jgi:hypothetical protein
MLSVLRETSAFDNGEIDQLVERIFERRMDRVARLAEREIGRGNEALNGAYGSNEDDEEDDPIDDDDDDEEGEDDEEEEDDGNQDSDDDGDSGRAFDPGPPPPEAISISRNVPIPYFETMGADPELWFNPVAYPPADIGSAPGSRSNSVRRLLDSAQRVVDRQRRADSGQLAPDQTDISPSSPITSETRYEGSIIVQVHTTNDVEQTNASVPSPAGEERQMEDGKSEEMDGCPAVADERRRTRQTRPYRSILEL